MNDQRTPIIDPYRTIRRSFVVICGGHLHSAVLLDYFVMVEHALDEARTQGERFGPWRAVAVMHAARIMQYDPNKRTVMATLDKLQQLGFIEAHPQNAHNKGGYAKTAQNRYRLCIAAVLDALREYRAVQNGTASDDAVQNSTALLVNFAPHTSAEMHGSAVQKRTQESVVESVYESAAAATAKTPPPPPDDLSKIIEAWLGRKPTGLESDRLMELAAKHGDVAVAGAIRDAAFKGGRTPKYVAVILENDSPRPGAPKPPRQPYVAPEEVPVDKSVIDEMRALRREIEAKRRLADGGKS